MNTATSSKREIAARRAESRRLGKACAELVAHNLKLERERYWERATCAGKERTWGEPDVNAPLRRALRWSDPETFDTQGREWVEGHAAWIGEHKSFASFFGLGVELGKNKRGRNENRVVRFFMLVDNDDTDESPMPRGFLVAIGLERAYIFSTRGFGDASLVKTFSEQDYA